MLTYLEDKAAGRELLIFPLLAQSLSSCRSQGLAKLQPGARNSILVSNSGGRSPSTLMTVLSLPRHISRSWERRRASRTRSSTPIWDAGIESGSLTHTSPYGYFSDLDVLFYHFWRWKNSDSKSQTQSIFKTFNFFSATMYTSKLPFGHSELFQKREGL